MPCHNTFPAPRHRHSQRRLAAGLAHAARVHPDADRLGLPFLGEIPLNMDIRVAADGGAPIVASKPESPQARAFQAIAKTLIENGNL